MSEEKREVWTCGNCRRQHFLYDPKAVEFFCADCESWTRTPYWERV